MTLRQIVTSSITDFLAIGNCSPAECVLTYTAYDTDNTLLSSNFFYFDSLSVGATALQRCKPR